MKNARLLAPALLGLLLAGCAPQPVKPDAADEAAQKAAAAAAALPRLELTDKLLFEILVAEVAAQRGDQATAALTFLELARSTRDPRLAQRAAEVALQARLYDAALEASLLWLEADPGSVPARQMAAALLVSMGRLQEARAHLEALIGGEGKNVGQAFIHLTALLARVPDKPAALALVRELARPHPRVAEARLAVAQAAAAAGDLDLALAESKEALALRPDWESAALLHGQVLARRAVPAALDFYRSQLQERPKLRELRLAYARLLVTERQYAEARRQFQRLVEDAPGNAEVLVAVGLLSLQLKDFDLAERNFKGALEAEYRDPDAVRYYLGQLEEERKRYPEAEQWYRAVSKTDDQYLQAQMKVAQLLAKQGRLEDARRHLQELAPQNNQQRAQLAMAEAQLLREAGRYQEAYDLLSRALEKLPNFPDLLYDRAMAAEKLSRIDVMEADLRKLIQIKPDHAHAYNALGYSLADRSQRLQEAFELIAKAYQLAPEDPFIMDSMGWIHYRLGNLKEGLDYLARAYKLREDPEIAAHLGELLWVKGERGEARRIWDAALKEHPDNEVLRTTVQRLAPR